MCDKLVSLESIGLSDCLSCAGCVSLADDTSDLEGIEIIKKGGVNLVMTPQVKMSLFYQMGWRGSFKMFRVFEFQLVKFLSKNKNMIVDSTIGSRILLNKEISQVSKEKPVISSICPGTVLYLMNTLEISEKFLSSNLSPVEISGKFAREMNSKKVVSVVMCKDKKIEGKKEKFVDYSVTSKEIFENFLKGEKFYDDFYEKEGENFYRNFLMNEKFLRDAYRRIGEENKEEIEKNKEKDKEGEISVIEQDQLNKTDQSTASSRMSHFDSYLYSVSRPLDGSTSGGVFEGVLKYFQVQNEDSKIFTVKNNPKHKEFGLLGENRIGKFLQLFSSTRIVSFVSKLKKDPSILSGYSYIEMNMCAGGCLNGPSQGEVISPDLYNLVKNDRITKEEIKLPNMVSGSRKFRNYKKNKEKRNYLVEW